MIKLRSIADDDPVLGQSRLLKAMELAFDYADTHGGIGLTQTKAFKCTGWPKTRPGQTTRQRNCCD